MALATTGATSVNLKEDWLENVGAVYPTSLTIDPLTNTVYSQCACIERGVYKSFKSVLY